MSSPEKRLLYMYSEGELSKFHSLSSGDQVLFPTTSALHRYEIGQLLKSSGKADAQNIEANTIRHMVGIMTRWTAHPPSSIVSMASRELSQLSVTEHFAGLREKKALVSSLVSSRVNYGCLFTEWGCCTVDSYIS